MGDAVRVIVIASYYIVRGDNTPFLRRSRPRRVYSNPPPVIARISPTSLPRPSCSFLPPPIMAIIIIYMSREGHPFITIRFIRAVIRSPVASAHVVTLVQSYHRRLLSRSTPRYHYSLYQ